MDECEVKEDYSFNPQTRSQCVLMCIKSDLHQVTHKVKVRQSDLCQVMNKAEGQTN